MTKLEIGSEVLTKQLGPPGLCKVIGISNADVWVTYFRTRGLKYWDKHYPDWRGGLVCSVMFKTPQKPYTYEEYAMMLSNRREVGEQAIRVLYKYNVGYVAVSTYPMDDLELM